MTPPQSPYAKKPEHRWAGITQTLLDAHPLKSDVIREVALASWSRLWETTLGSGPTAIPLSALRVPATVVGYFFEVLFAAELQNRSPNQWRRNESTDEKDLVNLNHARFSIEMKSSGQLGDRVFGNRSYGQEAQDANLVKKEKSGYYLTANFYNQTLTLLRFGWIDASDWKPQKSQTGQMAELPESVYAHKLVVIPGDYQLDAPLELLAGVGAKTAKEFHALNLHTIRELLDYPGDLSATRLRNLRAHAIQKYRPASSAE